jgi:hypothetical protein
LPDDLDHGLHCAVLDELARDGGEPRSDLQLEPSSLLPNRSKRQAIFA